MDRNLYQQLWWRARVLENVVFFFKLSLCVCLCVREWSPLFVYVCLYLLRVTMTWCRLESLRYVARCSIISFFFSFVIYARTAYVCMCTLRVAQKSHRQEGSCKSSIYPWFVASRSWTRISITIGFTLKDVEVTIKNAPIESTRTNVSLLFYTCNCNEKIVFIFSFRLIRSVWPVSF